MDEAKDVDLETLVRRTLRSYVDRIVFDPGANAQLDAAQVQPLGLSLNELATNAVKYGALSVPDGSIRLSWDVEHERERPMLSLVWTEENGPEIAKPDYEGFGTGLIRHSIDYDLNGELDTAYDKGGLECSHENSTGSGTRMTDGPADEKTMTILVVEDEFLIGAGSPTHFAGRGPSRHRSGPEGVGSARNPENRDTGCCRSRRQSSWRARQPGCPCIAADGRPLCFDHCGRTFHPRR